MLRQLLPVLLLTISNVFMTFAWYGHLKFRSTALITVILVSWGIAFFEYCFQVPANRIGHEYFSAAQLKTIQEVITLVVFSVFSILYLKEEFKEYYDNKFSLYVSPLYQFYDEDTDAVDGFYDELNKIISLFQCDKELKFIVHPREKKKINIGYY